MIENIRLNSYFKGAAVPPVGTHQTVSSDRLVACLTDRREGLCILN